MIGVYDYTVLATYLSLAFGVSGILAAMNGSPYSALLCLMVSGLLDAFDGRIARTKKNRTEQEKRFGIQIDSLNDVVCFGVLPGVIGASLGGGEWWLRASVLFYILAALIRLAYFNVTEEERQSATNEHRHYYLGVPVTAASFVMPLFWALPLRLGSAPAVIYAVGAKRISPLRSALKRGILFSNHNDTFVTPIDPLLSVWSAVNRITSSGQVLGEEYTISVMDALRSVTSWAAYQACEETSKGSLEPGKLADMVVLGGNPLTVDKKAIRDIPVLATIVGNELVYGSLE